jgi:hypothetical protein
MTNDEEKAYLAMIAAWAGENDLAREQLATITLPPELRQLRSIKNAAVLGSAPQQSAP